MTDRACGSARVVYPPYLNYRVSAKKRFLHEDDATISAKVVDHDVKYKRANIVWRSLSWCHGLYYLVYNFVCQKITIHMLEKRQKLKKLKSQNFQK